MAHHQLLTAHSQLTTLSPDQIHYLQFPAGLIPGATIYHQQDDCLNQHETLTLTSTLTTTSEIPVGSCLFCLASLAPRSARAGKPLEYFEKACELLQVSINEILHEWSCPESETHPFCSACTEVLHELSVLQNQLVEIQTRIEEGVENIRQTLQENNDRVPIDDTRAFNFRSRALKYGDPNDIIEEIPTQFDEDINEETANNIVSELSSLLNSRLEGLDIEQDSSLSSQQQNILIEQSAESIAFASLEAAVAENPSIYNQAILTALSDCVDNELQSQEEIPDVVVSIPDPNDDENYYFATTEDFNTAASVLEEDNNEGSLFNQLTDDNDDIPPQELEKCKKPQKRKNATDDPASSGKKRRKSKNATDDPASSGKKRRKGKNATDDSATSTKKSQNRTGATRHSNEYFAPVITDSQGMMVFEGVEIIISEPGYQCGLCGASCGKRHDGAAMRKIKIHIKGFHLGAYKCSICSKNFTSNDILSQHIARAHKGAENNCCDICARPIKPRYMNSHKFTHMNTEEKEAFIASGYKPHRPRNELGRFECQTCNKVFKKRSVLLRHETSHIDTELRKEHKCFGCDRAYTSLQTLKEHILAHHDTAGNVRKKMCPICGKMILEKGLPKHVRSHANKEDRPYACRICGTRLVNEKSLRNHEAGHGPDETPEKFGSACDVCGKMFKTKFRMICHRRHSHQNHWKLAVPAKLINDVSFDQPSEYGYLEDLNNEGLQHVNGKYFSYQLYHVEKLDEPKGYRCCTCLEEILGEEDAVEEAVKVHIRAEHIGNFRCNMCTKRMKNIDEVMAHKRSEHKNILSINCEVCKKPGIPVKKYKSHLWLHKNPYDVADAINAGESFCKSNEVSSQQAVLVELGIELSFGCALCTAKFERVEHLHHHRISKHPGAPKLRVTQKVCQSLREQRKVYSEEQWDCSRCKRRFDTEKGLNRHMNTVHSKEKKGKAKKKLNDVQNCEKKRMDNVDDVELDSFSESEEEERNSFKENSDDSSQSDPEFKVAGAIVDSPRVKLRDRSTLRRRAKLNYSETDIDYSTESTEKNERDYHLPVPKNLDAIKKQGGYTIEYIYPDEKEDLSLISEDDIKTEHEETSRSSTDDDNEWP